MAWLLILLFAAPAHAVTMTLASQETPYPGVTFRHYTTTSPSTHTWVALVDLCTERVHVESTRVPSGLESTGSWAGDEGVQLATNGDFYRSPLRVYGDAVGRGIPWPLDMTGADPQYSYEWFYERYGWIAFGADSVEFTHSEWVKNNASTFGGLNEGWMNGTVRPPAPAGTLALVSGFPELVVEGQTVTCSSPTASNCFPDRSDMRDRHPRTAMGITQDRQTLILTVVDGRTSISSGMYGAELADVMGQLGAWVAFNLDGGGSSQMWLEDRGYANSATGNNSGGIRSVGNHWGVFAGAEGGRRLRPGHCVVEPVCGVVGPGGGTVSEESDCFQAFGPPEYWREEAAGHGGHLYWTNAFSTDTPSNWAWWRLHLEEAGEYLVEYRDHATWGAWTDVNYAVRAGGADHDVVIDQSGSGWQPLGTWTFDAGGDQWVAVYDDGVGVPADQHVVADAIRLTRVGPWCGDGVCDAGEDCASCAGDCAGPVEVPGNGVDDDCDGEVDEGSGDDDDLGDDDDSAGAGDDDSEGSGDDDDGDDDDGDDDAGDDDDSAGQGPGVPRPDGAIEDPGGPPGCSCYQSLSTAWLLLVPVGLRRRYLSRVNPPL
jgi:hypothetical protein